MGNMNNASKSAKWYVVHTYSGYENKVKTNLEKIIENRSLENLILDIKVPTEDVVETKGEEKKLITRKIFPGYVLIKMVMTDDTWYIIRNTTGVTGFVGPDNKPEPLTEEEIASLGVDRKESDAGDQKMIEVNYSVGDMVSIVAGPLMGFTGTVESIDTENNCVNVTVSMFGRDTSVELELAQVQLTD